MTRAGAFIDLPFAFAHALQAVPFDRIPARCKEFLVAEQGTPAAGQHCAVSFRFWPRRPILATTLAPIARRAQTKWRFRAST